jgi:hypothetical protein
MQDLIGNELAVGDKVHVQLVAPNIIGFIAAVEEPSALELRAKKKPGHLLVTCTIAIPADAEQGTVVPHVVKVYDAQKTAQSMADKAMAALTTDGKPF